eukprot:sb/3474770/
MKSVDCRVRNEQSGVTYSLVVFFAQVSAPHRASPSLEAIRSESCIELLFCRACPVPGGWSGNLSSKPRPPSSGRESSQIRMEHKILRPKGSDIAENGRVSTFELLFPKVFNSLTPTPIGITFQQPKRSCRKLGV